jgi:hypothetical protein
VLFLCPPNCNVTFKITVEFEIIIINFYSINDFKSHITIRRTLEEHLAFPIVVYVLATNYAKKLNLHLTPKDLQIQAQS